MSYILEALRKSEHTRQQGKVPDLATLPMVDAVNLAPPASTRLPLLASGLLLLAVAVAGWWRPWQAPPESVTAAPLPPRPAASLETTAVPTPTPTSTDPAPAAAPPAPVAPEAVAARPKPAALASHPQPVQSTPPAAPPEQPRPALQVQALPPAPKAVLPTRALPPAAPATATSTAASASTALPAPPSRVLSFYELPSAVRERIPALAISGFSYTEEPDMRMAVINDRVLRQGESAAPGITLERIASDGVVLNFSGYRFRPQR